ncbi:MAG: hypothetical protein ACM3VT_03730 [Solirubrobacterales bacterium]
MQAIIHKFAWVVVFAATVGGKSQEESPFAVGPETTAVEISTLSPGHVVLRENFDDNQKAAMWRVHAEDPDNCSLLETKHRLELRASAAATNATALYVSNSWRLDSNEDFALRVDLHYSPATLESGWVGFGLTPNGDMPREQQVGAGMGASDLYSHFWYRMADGPATDMGVAPRFDKDGTMYMSYNAALDEFYISDRGYGPENAWMMRPGLIQGRWGGKPLHVWIGGYADGLRIAFGQAYIDNLVIESGTVLDDSLRDVYRFWSPVIGTHFYTIDVDEMEMLRAKYPQVWIYEGRAFSAFADDSDSARKPVYRFWAEKAGGHFFTMDEEEKNELLTKYADVWVFEGIAFYAYPCGSQPTWASPVYQFWSTARGVHFYTASEAEKENLIANYPKIWKYEGIAWYAVE